MRPGSRQVPLDDEARIAKFEGLVAPIYGDSRAKESLERLWSIETLKDATPLIEALAR